MQWTTLSWGAMEGTRSLVFLATCARGASALIPNYYSKHYPLSIHCQAASFTMTVVAETFISIVWGVLSIATSLYLLSYLNSPLRDFPGPILAGLTDLWRFLDVFHGRPDKTQLALHRKYGSAVRIGPKVISLSDPSLISKVYTTKRAWRKVSKSLYLQVYWLTHIS